MVPDIADLAIGYVGNVQFELAVATDQQAHARPATAMLDLALLEPLSEVGGLRKREGKVIQWAGQS